MSGRSTAWYFSALMGLAMAVISVTFQAEQGISGIGLYLFGLGMSELLFQKMLGTVETVSGFGPVHIPVLSDLPVIGPVFFEQAAWDLAQWRDFPEPWTRPPFARDAAVEAAVDALHAFADLSESPSYARDNLFVDTAPARHLSQEIRLQTSIGIVDYDGWEARLVDLSRHRSLVNARHGRGPGYRQGVSRAAVVSALEGLRAPSTAVVTDARRKEVYWAVYDDSGRRTHGPDVGRPADVQPLLSVPNVVGDGAVLYGFATSDTPRYPSVALLASSSEALPLTPLYLRRPDAVEMAAR